MPRIKNERENENEKKRGNGETRADRTERFTVPVDVSERYSMDD